MPFPFYQYVINPVVILNIRRDPDVLKKFSVREHRAFNN